MINRLRADLNPVDFGIIVEELNNDYGLSLNEIAQITGYNLGQISEMKNGRANILTMQGPVHFLDIYLRVTQKKPPFFRM